MEDRETKRKGVGFILSFDRKRFHPSKNVFLLYLVVKLFLDCLKTGCLLSQFTMSSKNVPLQLLFLLGNILFNTSPLPFPKISTNLSPSSLHISVQTSPYQIGVSWAPYPNSSSTPSLLLSDLNFSLSLSPSQYVCVCVCICLKTLHTYFFCLSVSNYLSSMKSGTVSVLFPRACISPIK